MHSLKKKTRGFCILALWVMLAFQHCASDDTSAFVSTSGTQFLLDGRPLYSNGFNAYWLMYVASNPVERGAVSAVFEEASSYGMKVVRTWAFGEAGERTLQPSPGQYNEDMFKGLDFVVSEAKKYGMYLILSLTNNFDGFGGRPQYVQWARSQGQNLSSDDDFYTNDVVKGYYKNHVQAVLTRVNNMTGVAYMDEPAIFAWELINEPRCPSDLSGETLQNWITEMAGHVKFIDSNHLLAVGMEGFYGESMPERKICNPGGYQVGTDFISNHMAAGIDFATIHAYPDNWLPSSDYEEQLAFLQNWIQCHVQDADSVLRKPLIVTEFGRSSNSPGYNVSQRDEFFSIVFNAIYRSATAGGPFTGGLFWQLLPDGMDIFRDGYEVVFSENPSTAGIISQQSRKITSLNNPSSRGAPNKTHIDYELHA